MLSLLRNRNASTNQPQVSSRRTRRGVALAVAGVSLGAVTAGCTPAPPSNLGTT
ncbi:MAG: hypothetical protein QOJ32_2072, partial [Frankiaceae bacterium]|nr:hypothetical protein [Frankiaceae bacterium]